MQDVRDISTATARNGLTDAERDEFLRQPHVTRFTTNRSDGWAHTTPIYYTWTGHEILHSIGPKRQHLRNLERDGRVTECIDVDFRLDGSAGAGAVSVVCFGVAEIVEDAALVSDMTREMLIRYMGAEDGPRYFAEVAHECGNGRVVLRVRPVRWITWDYRKVATP
ncbi:MAG TPA: pyridoxamine 5'-phosphate oxidase family protein [Acidimicrobiales bacterium]|nr:pyridoxamine 5'-phosphate oxidase family protein [Acidimicrobiales bacterium]